VVLKATIGERAGANSPSILPEPVTRLATTYQTLPKSLKEVGYATGHFGKWHLGSAPYSPLEHGFDVDLPHWPGPGPAGSFVAPWQFPDFDPATLDEHIEDRMAREAVAFMEANQDKPFYLNYWMFSVHAPFDAKRDLIEKYRGLVNAAEAQRSPIYAAMVESMDDAVGALLDTLDRLKIADNTIIIFSSDNGGNMYNVVEDTTATSNAPLRGGKATMYEGGTRVPQVVCWPNHISAGSRTDVLTNTCDIYPTVLDMLRLKPAPGQRFDGESILPALKGEPLERKTIFTFFPHNPPVPEWMPPAVSVHRDDWKLIRLFACGASGKDRWKLFNLREDIGERTDLANAHPEIVEELDSLIAKFLRDADAVVPIANPAFEPSKYNIEDEGKPAAGHFGGPTKTQRKSKVKAVRGWTPSGDCELTFAKGSLMIDSFGGDPHLSTTLKTPIDAGDAMLEFTVQSDSSGEGQVFWQEENESPAFAAVRTTPVNIIHDNQPHVYQVPIKAAKPILGIRIDPSTAGGTIKLSKISLRAASDETALRLIPVAGD